MDDSLPKSSRYGSRNFRKIVDAFLGGEDLPFAEVLSAERIFQKHGCSFGLRGIYTTAIRVWSFLSQVLRDGKEASCQSAVARILSYCMLKGLRVPTQDTGDYCRAPNKLSEGTLRDVSCEVAEEIEQAAVPKWLWNSKLHAKLVDGVRHQKYQVESKSRSRPLQIS
jgi:hypothetical protein